MHIAAVLLAAVLAAPVHAGAPAPASFGGGAALSVPAVGGQAVDYGERRTSRARAPVAPALRRLLRKRDLIAPVLPTGGHETADRSVSFLALDLDRSSTSLLGRIRPHAEHRRVRIRLVLAGVLTHALHRPPPILPG